ncbi:probable polygalacturonase At3g15720 [Ananas comosus]|uniref:Probable polygalacturonase At3g15720 n=1 Tax=Ananas comosus TaxID=4615 RepID=A0A6P5EXG2_ANACO|nr:probable polygalacturonase At3g15720 [Ananas comosus]
MVVPSGKTFLLSFISFRGPCNSNKIRVRIEGDIVAPSQVGLQHSNADHWITFADVNGLTVDGSGQIDGRGSLWWACKATPDLSGLRFKDSPKKHVTVDDSAWVRVFGITVEAPEDSPNTDGVHIERSRHAEIVDTSIGTGDDCISIGPDTADLNISRITCGPGHGISIGSLGKDESEARVEQIHVSSCSFFGTSNGVRIKTWQGGSGFARRLLFEQLEFDSVKNPIVIDQYYCDGGHKCHNEPSAVEVSDVRYAGVIGSTTKNIAITLNCSRNIACTGIIMENISISHVEPGAPTSSFCVNAHGRMKEPVVPRVPCLN